MRKIVYKLVCNTCGRTFESTCARFNCEDCGKLRAAGAAARRLIERSEAGELITREKIETEAINASCKACSIRRAMARQGYVYTSAMVRELDANPNIRYHSGAGASYNNGYEVTCTTTTTTTTPEVDLEATNEQTATS